ncbi:MAG: T9SS type A sorting domain-containing protein [Bacteroidia bacterium]
MNWRDYSFIQLPFLQIHLRVCFQINNTPKQNVEMEIINISGHTVLKNQTLFAQNIIDLYLELEQGIYFVKINSQDAQKVVKLVVN